MIVLNIWEVRAEAGKKEPYLDVAENVCAPDFGTALDTLRKLITERVSQYPALVKVEEYELLCVRLLQQVKTVSILCP